MQDVKFKFIHMGGRGEEGGDYFWDANLVSHLGAYIWGEGLI